MENMLHLTPVPAHTMLPNCCALEPERLPPAITSAVTLPVIDMSCSREEVRQAMLDAGKEFGFFQVVNHGVSEQVLRDMEVVCEEFLQLPAEDKAHLYSDDNKKLNRLFSGSTFKTGSFWMDCLRLACTFPGLEDSVNEWPEKPKRFREVFQKFVTQARGMGLEILQLLCEGLGLPIGYFEGEQTDGNVFVSTIWYPPCPNASTTLGLPPHCDRNLITMVLSGTVPGLEVFYNGDWLKVEPVRNAFVINFGIQLEVVTNGIIKSAEHRVLTNAALPRTSVVTSLMANDDYVIGPAEELLSEDNPARYRNTMFRDFMRLYNKALEESGGDVKQAIKYFKI
ncbi:hypothetical protein QOZ80_4BG0352220 [Eleusine coracana subsp. coracana]|nr:hypothetical protein QOZ80_4BG0352220 [Eleusine coracana subsp. coracana]